MDNFNTVFDPHIHTVHRDHILGVVVLDLHQVADLTVGIRGKLDADLDIDFFIPARCNEVDFFRVVFPNENIVAAPLQFHEHDIYYGRVQHLAVISKQALYQGHNRQIELLLSL